MTALEATIRQIVSDEIGRGSDGSERNGLAEVMTADQVAEFLAVDRKTVYDYANRGRIPHRRLGKRLLFSRSAVTAWLAGSQRPERR